MLESITLSEKERQFFEIYLQLLKKYYDNPQRLNILLELKALELGIEDLKGTLEKIEEILRHYAFFKSQRSHLEEQFPFLHPDLLTILKKYPYFVEYEALYSFPEGAQYRSFKWREPLLLAAGNDGKVRVWKYEDNDFHFLFEVGQKSGGEYPLYELYKDHLFYILGNRLEVYYLPSRKLVASVDIGQPATALNVEDGKLFLYKKVGDIAIRQQLDLKDGEVIFGPADPIAPTGIESGEMDMVAVDKQLVKVKDGHIIVLRGKKKEEKISFERVNRFNIKYPINDIFVMKNSALLGVDGSPPLVVDIESGKPLMKLNIPVIHTHRIRKHPLENEVALSHEQNLISIWDLETLQPVRILESYFIDVLALDFSPDGRYLAAAGEGRDINIWDTSEWKLIKDLDLPVEGVTALAFSPDGKYLAAGSGDYKIYLISTEDWEVKNTLEYHEGLISDLLYLPDGEHLVSASWDGKALLWNTLTGEVERILESSNDRVWKLALTPDAKFLAIADWEGKVGIYRTTDWSMAATFIEEAGVTAIAFGEDKLLIGRRNGDLEVVEIRREETFAEDSIKNLTAPVAEEAIGINLFGGNLLVHTEGNRLKIWDHAGDKVFSAKVEGELTEVEHLREPKLELKVLPRTYIVRKDDYFFGAKGWSDYINILKGLEPVKEKGPFLQEITKPELLREL